MLVPAHSLVAHRGANRRSMVIISRSILMCSVLCQFFLRDRTRHDGGKTTARV